jgi:hypothetical protein
MSVISHCSAAQPFNVRRNIVLKLPSISGSRWRCRHGSFRVHLRPHMFLIWLPRVVQDHAAGILCSDSPAWLWDPVP